jgi:hypothetical protein
MKFLVATLFVGLATMATLAGEVEIAGMKSKTPDGWVEGKAGDMRLAAYKLPKAEGDDTDGELVVFYFKGGSGSVKDNFKRQLNRYKAEEGKELDVKESKTNVGKIESPMQVITGTYIEKFPPFDPKAKETPKPGYKQLYVVTLTESGDYYFRLNGPAKTIAKHEKDFMEFLKNFK